MGLGVNLAADLLAGVVEALGLGRRSGVLDLALVDDIPGQNYSAYCYPAPCEFVRGNSSDHCCRPSPRIAQSLRRSLPRPRVSYLMG